MNSALIERARAVHIEEEIARRGIKLRRQGRELVGPCPSCGGTDRFSINTRKQVWHCRGCKPATVTGDVIGLVMQLDGVSFADAVSTLAGFLSRGARASVASRKAPRAAPVRSVPTRTPTRASNKPAQQHDEEHERSCRALAIWCESLPIEGTLAERYLIARSIDVAELPTAIGDALRWHPRCPWGEGRHGCMVALWTDAITCEPRAIHRTAITADGEKAGRKSLGPTAGCVIRLWPDEAVTLALVIGEGIETVLAATTRMEHRGTLLRPAWAAGDAGHLAAFPVLAGITSLTILVDPDEAGQRATEECAARWRRAGNDVTRLVPKALGDDFNDLIQGGAHRGDP
jgi:hypothetical protein